MTLLCWSWIFSVLRPKMCTTMRCGRCSFALLERAGLPLCSADPRVEPCLFSGIVRARPVRSPAEPFGLSTLTPSERELVDHDTGLFARMLWLHATSTAGRRVHRPQPHFSSMVAFLLEQPQQVERYMALQETRC